MMDVGRLCVKTAGRDARGKCAIVDVVDDNYVLIDGDVRRRKCNKAHLEPLGQTIDIKKGASHEDVVSAFKKLGIELGAKKAKEAGPKPKKLRAKDRKSIVEQEKAKEKPKKKEKKAEAKKEEPKKEVPKEEKK